MFHRRFVSVFMLALRGVGFVFCIDVQNRRAVRHRRFGVRDIKRDASFVVVLGMPHYVYSDRW